MIVYSARAIFAVAVGVACGLAAYSLIHNGDAANCIGALSVVLFDLTPRLRNQEHDVPLLAPAAGGHIWFIPVWIIGTVVAVASGMMWVGWL